MKGRSAPGSSTPTSRPTNHPISSFPIWGWVGAGIVLVVAAFYVIAAFTLPNPLIRIAMRCLPVLPVAIWTLWFDRSRPLRRQSTLVQTSGRIALLMAVMAVAVLILGIGLNWLYDPNRVV